MTTAWFWLALSIIGNAGGQVFMKYAAGRGDGGFFDVYISVPFTVGAVLFGGSLLCYMRALADLPLAVAYLSVVGLSIVSITGVAVLLFGERVSALNGLGIILIFSGVVLLTRNQGIG